jgi:L-ascorbate metabolism protein UlaG (beta-lactamase superfamily)
MTIKKYPQSHLVITKDGKKLCIDPGSYTFKNDYQASEFNNIDIFLITHQHADHMDPEHIQEVLLGKTVFANSDVIEKLKSLNVEATLNSVEDRETFSVLNFQIQAVNLPHCKMRDGSDGPPNTGFLINGILFHPGDGDKVPTELTSENLALPIAGPSITLESAAKFAQDLGAKLVIPIHYTSAQIDPETIKPHLPNQQIRILKSGEETEI